LKRILILIAALVALSNAAALYFAVSPDSHFVVLNRAGDTLWKSNDAVPPESAWVWAAIDSASGDVAQFMRGRFTDIFFTTGAGSGCVASGAYAWAGGMNNTASGDSSAVGGGAGNKATGIQSTIGGGVGNTSSNAATTIGGGLANTASNHYATVGGGLSNAASGYSATVGGGVSITASNYYATVGGGRSNTVSSNYATVSGGRDNNATGYAATVGGGYANINAAPYGVVSGSYDTTVVTDSAAQLYGYGLHSDGKWSWLAGFGPKPGVAIYKNDSTVLALPTIVHGPMTVDSAFTLTGIKVDSVRVAPADTSTLTFWIGAHSFTIAED